MVATVGVCIRSTCIMNRSFCSMGSRIDTRNLVVSRSVNFSHAAPVFELGAIDSIFSILKIRRWCPFTPTGWVDLDI